ncbi:MAG: thermonuclease family protein [Myxococcota bacterium]
MKHMCIALTGFVLLMGTLGCDATQSQTESSSGVSVSYSDNDESPEERAAPGVAEDDKPASSKDSATPGGDTSLPDNPRGIVQDAQLRSWPGSVVDGDTVKAVGFGESIRLLNIDTDETYSPKERALAERATHRGSWSDYIAQKQKEVESQGRRFGNYGTQMGEHARKFARDFFEGIEDVKVEYESPTRTHGFFGRHLAYIWVERDGQWVNYNVEAVRKGISPYYTKYGFSQLYHDAFERAQAEAQKANRGIWASDVKGYPDYEARISYWNERAEQIQRYRNRFDDHPRYVDLAEDTAFANLRSNIGQRMVVFGEPTSLKERGQPQRLRMSYRYKRDFTVVAFDPHELTAASANPDREDFVYVEGRVSMYRGDPQLRFDGESFLRSGTNPPETTTD